MNNPDIQTAAIYARVSKDDQDTLNQLIELRGYCQKPGCPARQPLHPGKRHRGLACFEKSRMSQLPLNNIWEPKPASLVASYITDTSGTATLNQCHDPVGQGLQWPWQVDVLASPSHRPPNGIGSTFETSLIMVSISCLIRFQSRHQVSLRA